MLKTVEDLDKQLEGVETRLVSQALRNSDDKYFVEPYVTYLDLIWLMQKWARAATTLPAAPISPRARRSRSCSRPMNRKSEASSERWMSRLFCVSSDEFNAARPRS